MTEPAMPGPTVGVVGGGQLGRMMGEAGAPLGMDLIVLDPTPSCPADRVATDQIEAPFDDTAAIRELAERSDVLTFEIELADQDALERVSDETGVPVHPRPETLRMIHDKLVQKRRLEEAGITVPPFRAVDDADDLRAAMADLGAPIMLKARTGGYDGRGTMLVDGPADAPEAMEAIAGPAMAERLVDFERELSVMAVQGADGRRTYPVGENVHEEAILRETIVPARSSSAIHERAEDVALATLEILEGRGIFGIELFETRNGEILVNEIAPRPHNSGHWTIEGAPTSQFEQHLRAVCGWPLGATDRRGAAVMTNILGDVEMAQPARLSGVTAVLETPNAHLHWYGKREARPARKMGHITLTGGEPTTVLERARELEASVTLSTPEQTPSQ